MTKNKTEMLTAFKLKNTELIEPQTQEDNDTIETIIIKDIA